MVCFECCKYYELYCGCYDCFECLLLNNREVAEFISVENWSAGSIPLIL
jgi:hypothetical protein